MIDEGDLEGDGFDDDDDDDFEYEEDLSKPCAKEIVACFKAVTNRVDHDYAWELFAAFVKLTKPKKKKGSHDPKLDKELMDISLFPRAKQDAAILSLVARRKKTVEAVRRHLRRLQEKERQLQHLLATWREQMTSIQDK